MRKIPKDLIFLIIILTFSILGMKALLHPGLFTAHDIWHQVVRLYYYHLAVNDGQIPPYWIGQLAHNFGYPLLFFSYHFPWIIGVALMKLGLNFSETIKALFFLSYLGSGISMYFFARSLLKDKLSALLSSILYLWVPYHFLIIFVSASMGIAFIFTFVPLVLLGIHLIRERSRFGIIILSLGILGIILSHIMHLIFLFPLIFTLFLWEFIYAEKRMIYLKNITLGVLLGVLLASFYLLPAAYYNRFTRVNGQTGLKELYKRNFIDLNQLVYSKWGYSPIVNNAKNGEVSFQLGVSQWISVIILVLLIIFRRLSKKNHALGVFLLSGLAVSIFLTLDYSTTVWEVLVNIVTVDFPFRLLLPALLIASICAGLILVHFSKKLKILILIFLILVALYTNRNHLNVNQYTDFPIETYLNLETEVTTNTFNEYLPIGANDKLLGKVWNEAYGEGITFSDKKQATNFLSFTINSKKEASVSAGQFYFPGQSLYIDNELNQLKVDKNGLISFNVPKGRHNIIIRFEDTLITRVSKILTLTGFIILLSSFINFKRLSKKFTFYKS